ncbi:MAG: hypothetical protein IJX49_05480 [Clostridia bacterium]|nr:hypothetical protein [Clostridia bacterium]
MKENVQKEEGISLFDILKLLLAKIKILILVILVGGIAGGCFAVWRTIDVNYWGTTVEFYVNPERPKESTSENGSQYGVYGAYGRHVMDNIVKLLSSESFAEKVILEQNENGLPDRGLSKELDAAIDAAEPLLLEAENAKAQAETDNATAQERLTSLRRAWNEATKGTVLEGISYSDNNYLLAKSYYADEKRDDRDDYAFIETPALTTAYSEYQVAKAAANSSAVAAEIAEDTAEGPKEEALVLWRKMDVYQSELSLVRSAISYSYLQGNEGEEDANNLARSFIYVKINVLNDKAFAETLLACVKSAVPEYVVENMAVPNDYEGTNCQRISRLDKIKLMNPGYTTSEAIKYGILGAAAAFAIACVIIILIDRSDKRLRDHEIITKKFNVPVLGIVPTIDDLTAESNAKKKNVKNNKDTEVK